MTEIYPVVQALCSSEFALDLVCKSLSISRPAYYAWLRRVPSNREREDRELRPLVSQIFWENRRRYGTRRIVKALAAKSVKCSERRVARLMGEMDLLAIQPKSFRPRTTDSRHRLGYSPNLLPDIDEPTATDQLWVADITYIRLQTARFAYAALLMDRNLHPILQYSSYPFVAGLCRTSRLRRKVEFDQEVKRALKVETLRAIEHRQPGYSLAGCVPAELASNSPGNLKCNTFSKSLNARVHSSENPGGFGAGPTP